MHARRPCAPPIYRPFTANFPRVERAQIESLRRLGHTQTQIAAQTGSHQSTISRELARLAPGAYVARPAQEHADQRRHIPTLVPLLDRCPALVRHLRNFMKQRYSIAQASMLIARKYPDLPMITPAAVYNWLFSSTTALKRELKRLLIRPRVQRRSRKRDLTGRGKIANMRPISERPVGAQDRSGHCQVVGMRTLG